MDSSEPLALHPTPNEPKPLPQRSCLPQADSDGGPDPGRYHRYHYPQNHSFASPPLHVYHASNAIPPILLEGGCTPPLIDFFKPLQKRLVDIHLPLKIAGRCPDTGPLSCRGCVLQEGLKDVDKHDDYYDRHQDVYQVVHTALPLLAYPPST